MLLGTNIVRLTDRKYMMKLMTKFKDTHEKQQQKRIEERKKQELMRTKNMILHRFIPVQEAPIELRQYPLFKLYLHCDALIEKRRKAHAPKKVKMMDSLYKQLYPEVTNTVKDDAEEENFVRRIIYDGEIEQLMPITREDLDKLETEKDLEDGYMMNTDDFDRLHYETEGIRRLREAQTVDELYKKAFEAIGTLYSHVDEEREMKDKKQHLDDKMESQRQEQSQEEQTKATGSKFDETEKQDQINEKSIDLMQDGWEDTMESQRQEETNEELPRDLIDPNEDA